MLVLPERDQPEKVLLVNVEALTFTRGRLTTRWASVRQFSRSTKLAAGTRSRF